MGVSRTKAGREDVFLPRILAYRQVVVQAECARAVCAREFVVRPRGRR